MGIFAALLLYVLCSLPLSAQTSSQQTGANSWPVLLGTDSGLVGYDRAGKTATLWSGGSVRKIVSSQAGGKNVWALLGSEGVLVSTDLQNWEKRNQNLPVKTLKIFQDGKKSFLPQVQEIKDLEFEPSKADIMVCATKDRVYLSRNQGRAWVSLGAPPYRTNGIKAVAVAFMPASPAAAESPGVLTVFLSHSTYGVFYIQPDTGGAQWMELGGGLEKLETTGNVDEVADIAVALNPLPAASDIYVSQTFRRRIYKLDWGRKRFGLVWSDNSPFGTVDSLDPGKNGLRFVYEGTVAALDFSALAAGSAAARVAPAAPAQPLRKRQDIVELVRSVPAQFKVNCLVLQESQGRRDSERITLNELWLLNEQEPVAAVPQTAAPQTAASVASAQAASAQSAGKEGLYLPVNHAMEQRSLKRYLDIISSRKLNMVVIDMKDDYGRLRFTPHNPAIGEKGRVFRPLDIDTLLATFKARGVYAVARVVVFKDPELAAKEKGRYAVWDTRQGKPWAGYYDSRRKKTDISAEDRNNEHLAFFADTDPEYEIVRSFYDERWVDPYSEEVWEYTAAVAAELHQRGFDEIQFDYIRFPTDGANIGDASYRWQENGMDMESAILSFLRHIRSRVPAAVSIDIYGANGWYRTGARTGQEVELLAPWVDVICPMYYPSHFEQDFLAQSPAELRPWRIYFQGTLRTARIGRGQATVRPYVQAFFLNVSYDRKYYNLDYVRREAEGIRAAGNGGLTYWNNSGRYDDIPD